MVTNHWITTVHVSPFCSILILLPCSNSRLLHIGIPYTASSFQIVVLAVITSGPLSQTLHKKINSIQDLYFCLVSIMLQSSYNRHFHTYCSFCNDFVSFFCHISYVVDRQPVQLFFVFLDTLLMTSAASGISLQLHVRIHLKTFLKYGCLVA